MSKRSGQNNFCHEMLDIPKKSIHTAGFVTLSSCVFTNDQTEKSNISVNLQIIIYNSAGIMIICHLRCTDNNKHD